MSDENIPGLGDLGGTKPSGNNSPLGPVAGGKGGAEASGPFTPSQNGPDENSEGSQPAPFGAAAGGKQDEQDQGVSTSDVVNAASNPQGATQRSVQEAAQAAASGDMDKTIEAGTRAGAVAAADSFAPGTGAAVEVVLKTKAGRAASRGVGKGLIAIAVAPFAMIMLIIIIIAGLVSGISAGGSAARAYANDICIPKGGTYPSAMKGEERENATILMQLALKSGVGREGAIIAVMAALTRSNLRNADLQVELDKDPAYRPLGLFQTAPRTWASEFWKNADGTSKPANDPVAYAEARKAMLDPEYVGGKFYYRLKRLSNWKNLDPWIAATKIVPTPDKDGAMYFANYSNAISIVATLLNQAAGQAVTTIDPTAPKEPNPDETLGPVDEDRRAIPPPIKVFVYGDQLTTDLSIMDPNGINLNLDNVLVLGYNSDKDRGPNADPSEILKDPMANEAKVWVIGIGTFGGTSAPTFRGLIDKVMSLAAGRKVVWWNYPEPVGGYQTGVYGAADVNSFTLKNNVLNLATGTYKNLFVANWADEATAGSGLLEDDGAHLTLSGARIRSKVASLAIDTAEPDASVERSINTGLTANDYLDALQGTQCSDSFTITSDTGKFLDGTQKLVGAETAVARALQTVGNAGIACDDGLCRAQCLHLAGWIWGYGNACSYAEYKEMGMHCSARTHFEWLSKRGYAYPGDTNPPIGALMFWDTGSPEGHVATYIGGGMVVTNAKGPQGYNVYKMTAKQLGTWGPYMGWALPIFTGSKL